MIRPVSLTDLASASQGMLLNAAGEEKVVFESVSIDSRTICKGDLFVAIKGDSFDGHQFVNDAIENGCCAVVVEKEQDITLPALVVGDTRQVLALIGEINRDMFDGVVIGLTGSTGKTTTKNMLTAILSQLAPTCATAGNMNNEIGVPLTLLKIQEHHKYVVVEMGARSIGDIRYLGQFVKPEIAVLLNAGVAHIDVFGSYENIVSAKGEILDALDAKGCAVLNADDPAISVWSNQLDGQKLIRFSALEDSVDVWAENIRCHSDVSTYTLNIAGEQQEVSLNLPGHHNVLNSLAAASTAIAMKLDLPTIAQGLSQVKSEAGRLEFIRLPGELLLIDDSYNANPDSMKAALDVLSGQPGTKIAVLGEMAELGMDSAKMHQDLAQYAASTSIGSFYLIGPYADDMAESIGERANVFTDKYRLSSFLCNHATPGENILVKGSRSAAMDVIVQAMVKTMNGRTH